MTESLFTSQTPAVQGTDGSPGITTATTVKFAVDGTVSAIRFYATSTPSGTYTVAIWEVTGTDAGAGGTGTLLQSQTIAAGSITGNAFNSVSITPVSVVSTKLYRVGVHNPSLYVATNSFFTSALTNGNITGVQDNTDPLSNGWTIRQGTFIIDAALQYPRQVGSSASYFADVVFAAAGGSVDGTATQTDTFAGTTTAAVTRPTDGTQTDTFAGTTAAAVTRPTDGTQTDTFAGTVTATVQPGTTATQTATFAGTATATVTTPGVNADAGQTDTFAGTATAMVVHNATASGGLSLAGVATPEPDSAPVRAGGGWNSLLNIVRYNAAQAEADRTRVITLCPVHAYRLEPGRRDGTLHCVFGGELFDLHGNPVSI